MNAVQLPFLDLPARPPKPRTSGLTHVLDKGLPYADLPGRLATSGRFIDVWKFGWGTAYLDPGIEAKLALLAEHDIRACVGGTLLEVAWSQDKVPEFLAWAEALGFPCIEVSRGAVAMPLDEKRDLIRLARHSDRPGPGFTVLSEVGAKDPAASALPEEWAEEVIGDLAAGAALVLTEGRESGTVGMFRSDGSVRSDLVEALVQSVGLPRLVFEAPRKDQQAWFINRFGPEVNLANVAIDETLGLEALRLGLRADTLGPVARLPRLPDLPDLPCIPGLSGLPGLPGLPGLGRLAPSDQP
jgi:phosphosulfolactate synthase